MWITSLRVRTAITPLGAGYCKPLADVNNDREQTSQNSIFDICGESNVFTRFFSQELKELEFLEQQMKIAL